MKNNSKKVFSDNFGRKNIEYLKNSSPFSETANSSVKAYRPHERSDFSPVTPSTNGIKKTTRILLRRKPTIRK